MKGTKLLSMLMDDIYNLKTMKKEFLQRGARLLTLDLDFLWQNHNWISTQDIDLRANVYLLACGQSGMVRAETPLQCCSGSKALESLLVDGLTIKSKTSAIQIGPAIKSETKTIVMQNMKILTCKRGISIQLHDTGNLHDVWWAQIHLYCFTNFP